MARNGREPDLDMYGRPVVREGAGEVPAGIGGWLVLPLIGLVGTLLLTLANLVLLTLEMDAALIEALVNAEEPPLTTLRAAVVVSLLAGFAIIGTAASALYQFLRKKRTLPGAMTVHYLALIAACACEYYASGLIESIAPGQGDVEESQKWLIRAMVGGAIWTAYFWRSERVRKTFVN